MGIFAGNNASHFSTQLSQPIELSDDYEVGLSEIHISQIYGDVDEGPIDFIYREADREAGNSEDPGFYDRSKWIHHRMTLPEGNYQHKESFIADLNKLSEAVSAKYLDNRDRIHFTYKPNMKKVSIELLQMYSEVFLSPKLAKVLGMPKLSLLGPKRFYGVEDMILKQDYRSVFIYSDIVSPRAVGDYNVPLLRTLPPEKMKQNNVHIVYEKPHYIPVSRSTINSVEVFITDDYGEEIIFREGYTIITLHFRRRRFD